MNVALAKPIPRLLVYSTQGLDPDQTLAAPPRLFTRIPRATIGRDRGRWFYYCVAQWA
jgi:hypothetical protein